MRVPLVALLILSVPAIAAANGAMGFALEIFDFKLWAVYVVATVIFEAWFIGRALEQGWMASLAWSAGFNLITAFGCAGGAAAVFLHAMTVDGNALLWTLLVLGGFGIVSAVIEGALWLTVARGKGRALSRSLLAHVYGIPLALAILLVPARPYPGYEAVADAWRGVHLRAQLPSLYDDRFEDDGSIRQFKDFKELEASLDSRGGYGVCLFQAVYHRYDTHDTRTRPFKVEINQHVSERSPMLLRITTLDTIYELTNDEGIQVKRTRISPGAPTAR